MTKREYTVRTSRPKVQRFDYRDERGNWHFAHIRFPKWNPEKARWDKEMPYYLGGDVWGQPPDGSHRRLLYRLPELLRADPCSTVYVTEGESDCDALADVGCVATTHPLGAGNATEDHMRWLVSLSNPIVLTVDRDIGGACCAVRRYDLLRSLGRDATIVRPRCRWKGADVRDHLNAGYPVSALVPVDVDRLREVAAKAVPTASYGSGESSDWYVPTEREFAEWLAKWKANLKKNARRDQTRRAVSATSRKEVYSI